MRPITSAFLALSLFFAASAFAQGIMEHVAAGGGSTAGAAAGKPVSDGISKIFGHVDKAVAKAADIQAPVNKPAPKQESTTILPLATSDQPQGHPRTAAHVARKTPVVHHPQFTIVREGAGIAARTRQPTLEEVLAIQTGATKHDVLSALGAPFSTIAIPDEGHLIEVYRYRAKGELLATIRLDNGTVSEVLPERN